jgi:hypothetical protein
MSGAHSDIGPELRRLAQAILDGIDPAVRAAAALTAGAGAGTGKCQQVWCPVCALAALATGDQHPLLTVVADHSVALVEMLRGILADGGDMGDMGDMGDIDRSAKPPPGDGTAPNDGSPDGPGSQTDGDGPKTRYQSIPITVEE